MEQKVYLIVQDLPVKKVYARVFGSYEKAEKALAERDERSGEKLYSECHIIERTIEYWVTLSNADSTIGIAANV